MDRFPCAQLASPYYSIGSDLDLAASHEYDTVFDAVLEKGAVLDARTASKATRCSMNLSTLEGWLLQVARPLGFSSFLGTVPVTVNGLRFSPSCISLGQAGVGFEGRVCSAQVRGRTGCTLRVHGLVQLALQTSRVQASGNGSGRNDMERRE